MWAGAKYAVTDNVDVIGGYYHYAQNNFFATGPNTGCSGSAHSQCSGTFDAFSAVVDWRFAAKWDTYIGFMFSQVNGGLANGFLQRNNIDPDRRTSLPLLTGRSGMRNLLAISRLAILQNPLSGVRLRRRPRGRRLHILINDFIGGVLDRGMPLYVRNLIDGLNEEGFRVSVVRAPRICRKLPRSLFYVITVSSNRPCCRCSD